MNEPPRPEDAPGHSGAGYGEQVPENVPPHPAPKTDADTPAGAEVERPESSCDTPTTSEGDDGSPVVFTPEDVRARPPDHTPTEAAPESEKAGLIFERS
jgi:hypothetical protein